MRVNRKTIAIIAVLAGGLVSIPLLVIFSNLAVVQESQGHLFSASNVPESDVILVLGAKVEASGRPSHMLEDRLNAAADLFKQGKGKVVLVSGDHGRTNYDEPTAMRDYMVSRGVPKDKIHLDYAGFRTYDSFYRARDVFGVRKLIVVTNSFHLPRAVYLARKLGLDANGVASQDQYNYSQGTRLRNQIRETLARVKAWLDVQILRPKPRFLGEPISLEI